MTGGSLICSGEQTSMEPPNREVYPTAAIAGKSSQVMQTDIACVGHRRDGSPRNSHVARAQRALASCTTYIVCAHAYIEQRHLLSLYKYLLCLVAPSPTL